MLAYADVRGAELEEPSSTWLVSEKESPSGMLLLYDYFAWAATADARPGTLPDAGYVEWGPPGKRLKTRNPPFC